MAPKRISITDDEKLWAVIIGMAVLVFLVVLPALRGGEPGGNGPADCVETWTHAGPVCE